MYVGSRRTLASIKGGGPIPPDGFVFQIDADGTYLTDADGVYLTELI